MRQAKFCLRVVRWFFSGISRFRPTLQLTLLKMSELILTSRKTPIKKEKSIVCPIQQYFNHIRTMIVGKYDWFCDMKCRSESERSTRVFQGLERHFLCVQETHAFYSTHNQTQLFCESHELGLFSLTPIFIS